MYSFVLEAWLYYTNSTSVVFYKRVVLVFICEDNTAAFLRVDTLPGKGKEG